MGINGYVKSNNGAWGVTIRKLMSIYGTVTSDRNTDMVILLPYLRKNVNRRKPDKLVGFMVILSTSRFAHTRWFTHKYYSTMRKSCCENFIKTKGKHKK